MGWGTAGPQRTQCIRDKAQLKIYVAVLSSALLGFGKECGGKGLPAPCVLVGGGLMGRWGSPGLGPRTSLCLALPQDSEHNNREEEKGHSEAVT